MSSPNPARVVAYIDGFNLYHGLRDSGYRKFYWLDVPALAANLLKPSQSLAGVKYFTARISGPKVGDRSPSALALEAKRKRQSDFLDALDARGGIQIYYGHYLAKPVKCFKCGATWDKNEEKMTDVNIATEMMIDAHTNAFDMVLLISADSDQIPPVLAVRKLFPQKRVVVAFPPGRTSVDLGRAAHAYFTIGHGVLSRSVLPEEVRKPSGFILRRPPRWR